LEVKENFDTVSNVEICFSGQRSTFTDRKIDIGIIETDVVAL
jgi:hypothetical protein